jgi:DNA-binding NtrC family response regulator
MNSARNVLRANLESFVGECVKSGIRYKDALVQMDMEYIMQVLANHRYNISKSADELGINRNTLSKKIQEFRKFERFRTHQKLHNGR